MEGGGEAILVQQSEKFKLKLKVFFLFSIFFLSLPPKLSFSDRKGWSFNLPWRARGWQTDRCTVLPLALVLSPFPFPPTLKNLSFSTGVGGGREFENRLKYWVNHVPGNRWAMFGSSSENSSGSYALSFLWRSWNFLDTRLSKGTLISWLDLSINQFIKVNAWDEVYPSYFRVKHKTINKNKNKEKEKIMPSFLCFDSQCWITVINVYGNQKYIIFKYSFV